MRGKELRLSDLEKLHIGVSENVAKNYCEAARVCFDRHHSSPQSITLEDNGASLTTSLEWESTDSRARNAWANQEEATRDGAYGVALAAVYKTRGLVAVRRAESRTGGDYYLGEPGAAPDDLEASMLLEVSGTDKGDRSAIGTRLKQKIQQAINGGGNLPAMATVVGFRALHVASADAKSK